MPAGERRSRTVVGDSLFVRQETGRSREMKIQVAIDCADPHRLAAFYAAAFGYEVERHRRSSEVCLSKDL